LRATHKRRGRDGRGMRVALFVQKSDGAFVVGPKVPLGG
jgi:hypothetical protein